MTYFCWRQKQRILDEDNLNLTLFEPPFVPLLPLVCVSLVRLRLQTFLLESLRVLLGLLRSRLCWGVIVCIWALPNLILRALCSPSRSGEYRVRECLVGLIDGSAAPCLRIRRVMKDSGISISKDTSEKDWRDPSCGINEHVQFHNSSDPEAGSGLVRIVSCCRWGRGVEGKG